MVKVVTSFLASGWLIFVLIMYSSKLYSYCLRILKRHGIAYYIKNSPTEMTSSFSCSNSSNSLSLTVTQISNGSSILGSHQFRNFHIFSNDVNTVEIELNVGLKTEQKVNVCGLNMTQRRFMGKKGKRRMYDEIEDELSDSDEETDYDDDDDDDLISSKSYPEDMNLPNDYRDITIHVSSLRLDSVASKGLNIAKKKIEDYLLSSKLQLNGSTALKKSKTLQEGDYVDLISGVEDGYRKFKRVRVVHVSDSETKTGRKTVHVRAWRHNINRKEQT